MESTADILAVVARGESLRVEFKREIDNLESLAGEIVAFANSEGGDLLVGVDDSGALAGLADAEAVFDTLARVCRDRCVPPISALIQKQSVSGRDIVVLSVRPDLNRQKPYRTAGGRVYIRSGREKRDATGRELIRIAQAAGELHYDESPVLGAGLADLFPGLLIGNSSIEVVLPEHTYQKLCQAGHEEHRSETDLVAEAVEAYLEHRTPSPTLLGLFADEPGLADGLEREAIQSREATPRRQAGA